jgi:PAS domain S-box-containing protein
LEPNDKKSISITNNCNDSEISHEMREILDCIFDGVWIINGQGKTIYINKAVKKIADLEDDEVLGKHVLEPQSKGKYFNSVTYKALKSRKPVSIIDEYQNGKHCLSSGIPLFNEKGEIWRVVGIIRDVTKLENLHRELLHAQEQVRFYQDQFLNLEKEQCVSQDILGKSNSIENVRTIAKRLAKVDSTALILGETGVGKGLLANIIHRLSERSGRPFTKVNCGAIPETLIESELFGYEQGAFTGAKKEGKPGIFELTQGGTIFLDEIGELPLHLQVKLLQIVEDQQVFRIGGSHPIKLDVRIIAATNRNLEEMISRQLFREDLYYRLNVLSVTIPPLRERAEDIPILISHFLSKCNKKMNLAKRFNQEAIKCLIGYHWPGNIRELESTIESLVIMVEHNLIMVDDLPVRISNTNRRWLAEKEIRPLKKAVEELEKHFIHLAIRKYQNSYEAAEALGVSQPTVIRKAQKYGISFEGKWQKRVT